MHSAGNCRIGNWIKNIEEYLFLLKFFIIFICFVSLIFLDREEEYAFNKRALELEIGVIPKYFCLRTKSISLPLVNYSLLLYF